MSETSLVLFIDLKPDTKISLRAAAMAAIAWADLVERTGAHFDPTNPTMVELEASEQGSQIIKAAIKNLTDDPKELIKIAVVTSALFILKTSAAWTWEQALEYIKGPDAPSAVQSLTEEELSALAREVSAAVNARLAEEQTNRIYNELSMDENVTGVGMSSSPDQRPQAMVSREEFPSEIYVVDEEGFERRMRTEEADLVLLKPVLTTETTKRWGFSWAYGRLGATIQDEDFLDRMATGMLNVPMAQGIVFHVQMEITEERRGAAWEARGYNILRVISVSPPDQQESLLFGDAE